MSVIEHLASLGFTNATIVGESKGIVTVRILTSKGWAYERLATIADVDVWARGKVPG